MIEWKDISSYSQGDKERVPTIWECKIKSLQIRVHRYAGCNGWFLTVRYLDIDKYSLKSAEIDNAKEEALGVVKKLMYSKITEMQEYISALQ